jgi:KDO2-lipid IV(A) lauroyltransferase
LVSVPRAPATLAVRFGAPLVTGYILRLPNNRHHCRFDPPLYPDSDADPDQEIKRLTKIYTERIEAAIRTRPDHWLWTHRRFKPLPQDKLDEGAYIG